MSIALSPPFQASPFPLALPLPSDRPLRVLILGCWGQVGRSLQGIVNPNTTVIPWDRSQLDLTHLRENMEDPQTQRLYGAIKALHPDVIINGAAYTAVDRAEEEPDLAMQINGTALGPLAHLAQSCNAALIHISTDYIFNGFGHKPYREEDAPDPLGVYGRSKLVGERALLGTGLDRLIILRTAWVYSEFDRPNFLKTMLRLGQEREEVKIVADQVGSPTWARDIAEVIAALIPCLYQDPSWSGIYHYRNSGVASWYDFAVAIFEEAATAGWPLKLQRVQPIATADYPTLAQRPAYSVLDTSKICQTLDFTPPHWRQSLRQAIAHVSRP